MGVSSLLLCSSQSNNVDFRPCTKAEWNETAHTFANIEYLRALYVCTRPLGINHFHRRPTEDFELPSMGMAGEGKLNRRLRKDVVSPMRRVMGKEDGKI